MKKKVLVLANSDVGLYKFRKELLKRLIEEGYEVYISLPDGEFVKNMSEMGCTFINTPMQRRGMNPFKDLGLLKRYIKILKDIKPHVVLTYTVKPNVYGGLACSIKKIPYISNVTGLGTSIENPGITQKIVLKLYKMGIRKAGCVFFQNHSNRDFFKDKRIISGNALLLPGSGVNLEEFRPVQYPEESENIRFLFIGRIMRDKGINELFNAAQKVTEKYPDVKFDILGDYDEDYLEQTEALQKKGIVCYYGQQKDVRPFIEKSFAQVHPSYHEGMANVLLEAAACARPVIASDIPGCAETFEEGVSGFGVQAKNAGDLADKLIKFIELPYEEKKEMGIQGRKHTEKVFNRNIIVNQYIQQINKIMEEN